MTTLGVGHVCCVSLFKTGWDGDGTQRLRAVLSAVQVLRCVGLGEGHGEARVARERWRATCMSTVTSVTVGSSWPHTDGQQARRARVDRARRGTRVSGAAHGSHGAARGAHTFCVSGKAF